MQLTTENLITLGIGLSGVVALIASYFVERHERKVMEPRVRTFLRLNFDRLADSDGRISIGDLMATRTEFPADQQVLRYALEHFNSFGHATGRFAWQLQWSGLDDMYAQEPEYVITMNDLERQ